MTALPLNSVVATSYKTSDGDLFIKGFAVPGDRGNVAKVQVTLDDGKSWHDAEIIYQEGRWSWTLWEAKLPCDTDSGIVRSCATDTTGNEQPREGIWNVRGVAYNGWGVGKW